MTSKQFTELTKQVENKGTLYGSRFISQGEGYLLQDVFYIFEYEDLEEMVILVDDGKKVHIESIVRKLQPYAPETYTQEELKNDAERYFDKVYEHIQEISQTDVYKSNKYIDGVISLLLTRYGMPIIVYKERLKELLKASRYDLEVHTFDEYLYFLAINKMVNDEEFINHLKDNWKEYLHQNNKFKQLLAKEGVQGRYDFLDDIDGDNTELWLYDKELTEDGALEIILTKYNSLDDEDETIGDAIYQEYIRLTNV